MGQTVNLLAYAFGGSNPSLPTIHAGVAQSIEHQLPKLRVAGLSPVFRSTKVDSVLSNDINRANTRVAKWGRL